MFRRLFIRKAHYIANVLDDVSLQPSNARLPFLVGIRDGNDTVNILRGSRKHAVNALNIYVRQFDGDLYLRKAAHVAKKVSYYLKRFV